jgi:hypothetical protein
LFGPDNYTPNMNASNLRKRGFAVLALLCLMPRLSALTVVQNFSAAIAGTALGGHTMTAGAQWIYQGFDPNLGKLLDVQITGRLAGTMMMWDVNHYAEDPVLGPVLPIVHSPSISMQLFVNSGDAPFGGYFDGFSYNGDPVELQPLELVTFTAPIDVNFATTFSAPDDLARFADSSSVPTTHQLFVTTSSFASNFFGGLNATLQADATITYRYQVPDGGNVAVMLAMALAVTVAHRRICRSIGRAPPISNVEPAGTVIV